MSDRFLVKVIPPHGYSVYRFEVSRRRLLLGLAAGAGLMLVLGALASWGLWRVGSAAQMQRREMVRVSRQAHVLAARLRDIQRQNARIRHMVGLRQEAPPQELAYRGGSETIQMRLVALDRLERAVGNDEGRLARQAAQAIAERKAQAAARARALAAIPSIMPAQGPIDSPFGYRSYPDREFHDGVDIAADYGSPVVATADGIVAFAGWEGGYGLKVDIDHGNGYHTWYAHLSRVLVHPGERVARGQQIGRVGATGFATGPHLHYQLMLDGRAIDPAPFLHGVPPNVIASIK